jgi:hypothetical protein
MMSKKSSNSTKVDRKKLSLVFRIFMEHFVIWLMENLPRNAKGSAVGLGAAKKKINTELPPIVDSCFEPCEENFDLDVNPYIVIKNLAKLVDLLNKYPIKNTTDQRCYCPKCHPLTAIIFSDPERALVPVIPHPELIHGYNRRGADYVQISYLKKLNSALLDQNDLFASEKEYVQQLYNSMQRNPMFFPPTPPVPAVSYSDDLPAIPDHIVSKFI